MRAISEQHVNTINDPFELARANAERLIAEVSEAIHMRDADMLAMVGGLACSGAVLLDSTYGTGKTSAAKAFARAMGGTAGRIQGSADVMVSDITGGYIFDQRTQEFRFLPGPIFSNVVHVDEVQRLPEKTQDGLIEGMEENQVTVRNETHDTPRPSLLIATRNPDGLPLRGAVTDRFMVNISVPKQTGADRTQILHKKRNGYVVRQVVDTEEILHLQQVRQDEVKTSPDTEDAANNLIDRVYEHPAVDHETSIEGGFRPFYHVLELAKFSALMAKSRIVKEEDIAFAAKYVLPHRLGVGYDAMSRGVTAQDIVKQTLARTLRQSN